MAKRRQPSPRRAGPVDLCVVGGAGHVGLGLAILFASKGQRVLILDTNTAALKLLRRGRLPFLERDAAPLLRAALAAGRLSFSSAAAAVARAATVIFTLGTPIDEFLNPDLKDLGRCFERLLPHLRDEQLLILRSTVYPGVTDWLDGFLRARGHRPRLAFCPERIVEGHAIRELQRLPQLVSGTTPAAAAAAGRLFALIAPGCVRLQPQEAEFAKLFANAYRYLQFAISNQFLMTATAAGLDYYRILEGMKRDYPRLRDVPGAGFAAGPCLFKDTMQLTAFTNNQFSLGSAAMLINEGLPLFVVQALAEQYPLRQLTVGILGMAFKADSDDPRSSLSYKLKKVLQLKAKRVLTTDPLVKHDSDLRPLADVLAHSDLLILATPHTAYRNLDPGDTPVIDVWNLLGRGTRLGAAAGTGRRPRRRPRPARDRQNRRF